MSTRRSMRMTSQKRTSILNCTVLMQYVTMHSITSCCCPVLACILMMLRKALLVQVQVQQMACLMGACEGSGSPKIQDYHRLLNNNMSTAGTGQTPLTNCKEQHSDILSFCRFPHLHLCCRCNVSHRRSRTPDTNSLPHFCLDRPKSATLRLGTVPS